MDFDDLDDAEEEAIGEDGPVRKLPPWTTVDVVDFGFDEMRGRAAHNLPGDYFGLTFPHDKDQLTSPEFGPEWLSRAFCKCGVMPVDNEVTEIEYMKDVTGEVSGGAGLKYVLKVKYKTEKPYLHTDLFVKLPHKPIGSDRYYVSVMWKHDRPETVFNIWLSKYVPFSVPKLYFADINKDSTNFILITEQIKFAPSKSQKQFAPGDIEPAWDKYCDWELPDGGVSYYLACCRDLGKMAAYHKTGRLHPQVDEMFPMPGPVWMIPTGYPGVDPDSKKMNISKADTFIRFLSETAKAVFPPEITDKKWLEDWKEKMLNVMDFEAEIGAFGMGAGTPSPNDYVCLTHGNLQIDNAYFIRDEQNELQVGMLDWGATSCGPFIGAVQGGCISGAQVEVYIEHRDAFLQAALDSYEAHGGPKLDLDRARTTCNLMIAQWAANGIKNVAATLKDTKSAEWATITDWMDDRLMKRFYVRANCSQWKASLQLWQRLDIYGEFQRWQQSAGLPAQKG